jgi:hypothetical protein
MMPGAAVPAIVLRVESKYNWVWALFALLVWVAMALAFLLIAIPRH